MKGDRSINDWMGSHDSHRHGIRYASIDLEDEEAYPLEGSGFEEDMENMIDQAREFANIFVTRLSEDDACACALVFGKCTSSCKRSVARGFLNNLASDNVKSRLLNLFDEFILDYPELSVQGTLRTLFCENVVERCEKIYKKALASKVGHS